jgi:hypothetical protein
MRTKRPADDKEPEKKYFKAFYGGPVGLSELYWLSKAEPTSLPPAEEVYPGLYHGRSMALFDWNREADAAAASDEAAATTKRRGKGAKKEKTKMKGEGEEKVSEAKGEGSTARMQVEPNALEGNIWSDPSTKLFFGRAGWTPGQLESELQEGELHLRLLLAALLHSALRVLRVRSACCVSCRVVCVCVCVGRDVVCGAAGGDRSGVPGAATVQCDEHAPGERGRRGRPR